MKNRFWINVYLCLLPCSSIWAQGTVFNQLSTVPTASPQAANLGKFVEVPVSYFNGMADISIPVYEIKDGDISVPITLQYHPSAIKISEEGSWVGLGWALNAGGVITHQVKGQDDDDPAYYHMFGNMKFSYLSNAYDEQSTNNTRIGVCNASCDGSQMNCFLINGAVPSYGDLVNYFGNNKTDAEPDLYIYNFGKYSGKFFNNGTGMSDIGVGNVQFSFNNTTGIKAVTPDGYTYAFGQVEQSLTDAPGAIFRTVKTAYYLTTITSALGKQVTFSYKTFKDLYGANPGTWFEMPPGNGTIYTGDLVRNMPALSEYFMTSANPNVTTQLVQTFATTYSSSAYLDRIDFDNGYVKFTVSPRQDMYGPKLSEIGIYKTDGTKIKSYVFSYDYFVANSNYGDYFGLTTGNNGYFSNNIQGTCSPYPQNFRSKRLKLTGVKESGQNNETGGNYGFGYYEGSNGYTLPYKSSMAQDYWGYFNGASNATLVPDFNRYDYDYIVDPNGTLNNTQLIQHWSGANREPDPVKIKEGTLKTISYPTGGTSAFEYEIHNFYNEKTQVANVLTLLGPLFDYGIGKQTTTFTLDKKTWVQINGFLFCNCSANNCTTYPSDCGSMAGDVNSLYARITKANGTSTPTQYEDLQWTLANTPPSGTFSYSLVLDPGTYIMEANYPDNRITQQQPPDNQANRAAQISVKYYVTPASSSTANLVKTGGGLRVSKTQFYDPVSAQTIEKNYTYEGGVMMRFPIFYWTNYSLNYLPEGWYTAYPVIYLYSNPVFPYSFSANGSLVGYQRVTETFSDGNIGKNVYEYNVGADKLNLMFPAMDPVTILPDGSYTTIVTTPNVFNQQAFYIPGVPSTSYLKNGTLASKTVYDNTGSPVKATYNSYTPCGGSTFWSAKCYNNNPSSYWGVISSTFCSYLNFNFYPIQTGKMVLSQSTDRDYTLASDGYIQKNKSATYNPYCYTQEDKETVNGAVKKTTYTYATDYTGPDINQANAANNWLWKMQQPDKNMIGVPVETYHKVNGNDAVTGGSYVEYTSINGLIVPRNVYEIETKVPSTTIISTVPNNVKPAEMKLAGTIEHTGTGNIASTQSRNNITQGYLWGYDDDRPIARVTNAAASQIAYTGFEGYETANGGWSYTPFTVADCNTQCFNTALGSATAVCQGSCNSGCAGNSGCVTSCMTGCVPATQLQIAQGCINQCGSDAKFGGQSFVGSAISKSGLPLGNYTVSFWAKQRAAYSGSVSVNASSQTISNTDWQYYEFTLNSITGVTLSLSTVQMDELKLYPSDAQMTTYTHDPLRGPTSVTDENRRTTYYEYDSFGRMKLLRDNDNNILKTYQYHYQGQ